MTALPQGTVTFCFTDIEGSTALLRRLGTERYATVLADHFRILRVAVGNNGGFEVKTEGDALFAAFADPLSAVVASVEAQHRLASHAWPDDVDLRVRIGLHTGTAVVNEENDYVGLAVHQAARVAAAAIGGAVVLTAATAGVAGALPPNVTTTPLGQFRLRDFDGPVQLVAAHAPGSVVGRGAVRAVPADAHNLPTFTAPFIGRASELAELSKLIEMSRLVTVTGPGGAGKTRLVMELAVELLRHFDGGVWVALLAPLEGADAVLSAVAAAIGTEREDVGDVEQSVAAALGDGPALLVLDNCEHVIDGAARVARVLLERCPRLTIIATTRRPLNVAGEVVWRTPMLSLPTRPDLPVEALLDADAVRFFVDRARLADATFVVTPALAASVSRLCELLDGHPLALELAAARVPAVGVVELGQRLESSLKPLGSARASREAHHDNVRSLVEWSVGLLAPAERVLFERLSVFAGGWTLDAAEQVCSFDGLDRSDVLDAVIGLVEHSLVRITGEEPRRYDMLRVVWELARERLDASGATAAVEERFVAWASDLAALGDRAGDEVRAVEADNIIASAQMLLRWQDERVDRLLFAAQPVWALGGRRGDGERLLSTAIEQAAGRRRGRLLVRRADLRLHVQLLDDAATDLDEALPLLVDDPGSAASAHATMAAVESQRGNIEAARKHAETAAEEARRAEAIGEPLTEHDRYRLDYVRGHISWVSGDLESAREAFEAMGDRLEARSALGRILLDLGRRAEARSILRGLIDEHYVSPAHPTRLEALLNLVDLELQEGRPASAAGLLLEVLDADDLAPTWLYYVVAGAGRAVADLDPTEGVVLLASSLHLFDSAPGQIVQSEREVIDSALSTAAARLGGPAVAAAVNEGQLLPLDGSVDRSRRAVERVVARSARRPV